MLVEDLVTATKSDVPDDVDVWNALFALQLRAATADEASEQRPRRLKQSPEVAGADTR